MKLYATYNAQKMSDEDIKRAIVWRRKNRWFRGINQYVNELKKREEYRHMIRP